MVASRLIDSWGEIEIKCVADRISVSDPVPLVFDAHHDATPPFVIKVKSPTGALILSRTTRELPTGEPQSAPPVEFIPSVAGDYRIEIEQVHGRRRGEATLHVR
jgi:hypothetical protein